MAYADQLLLAQLYDETIGFRRVTGTPYSFDVQQYERYYLVRVARSLYFVSPIIRKFIDKPLMLFFEHGLDIQFENSKVERAFFQYIEMMPYTYSFEKLCELYLRSLMVDGELFVPLLRHETGALEFGFIPADTVLEVYTDPLNGMVFDSILYGVPNPTSQSYQQYFEVGREKKAKIARLFFLPEGNGFQELALEGEVLYFALNRFPFLRGRSIIETIMDYAYAYDEFVLDRLRRQKLANSVLYDVTIQGAEREQIRQRLEELKREPFPSSGGVRVHNEKETWQLITPQLASEDAKNDSEIILAHIYAGNELLTKEELGMSTPSTDQEKELVNRYVHFLVQNSFKPVIATLVKAVLYSCQKLGMLPKYKLDLRFQLNYRKYHTEMIRHIAVSLYQMASAMKIARERGWVTDSTAQELFNHLLENYKKGDETPKKVINIAEMNGIITTILRALETGLITKEQAEQVIQHYTNTHEYEWVGSGGIDLRGRTRTEKSKKPKLPEGENQYTIQSRANHQLTLIGGEDEPCLSP